MGGLGSGAKRKFTKTESKKRVAAYQKRWSEKNKQHKTEYMRKWRAENRERYLENDRRSKQNIKVKKLTKYLKQLRYEREHPGRCKEYYQHNRQRCINNNKEYRKRKKEEQAEKNIMYRFINYHKIPYVQSRSARKQYEQSERGKEVGRKKSKRYKQRLKQAA